jgi:molybdenum cofactor cytidylyltransferase
LIAAVVMAAGLSQRMGQPKMLLPWGKRTVIEQVVDVLVEGEVEKIIIVTGGLKEQYEGLLSNYPVDVVFNPHYENGEMLDSLKIGIQQLSDPIRAAFIVLGDQPQILPDTVRKIKKSFILTGNKIIIPSYHMRRGHPWLVERSLWSDVDELQPPKTLRNFLELHQEEIHYLLLDSPSILSDLDTPEDYEREKPK